MTAVKTREISAFLSSGYKSVSVVLLYGPEAGLIAERADQLALASAEGDSSNIIRLDGDQIAAEPGRLADEADAISMFGGRRAIRIRLGNAAIKDAVAVVLRPPPVESRIIIEAGDLKPAHAIRSLVEKSPHGAAVGCYPDDGRAISEVIDEMMAQAKKSLDRDARQALGGAVGQDRKRSRQEIEKLILYCGTAERITAEDVAAIVTDAAMPDLDRVVDLAFEGKIDAIESAARRVMADGTDPGVLVGFALRHAFTLLASLPEQGELKAVLQRHRIHWSRERSVSMQRQRWSEQRLLATIQALQEAVLQTRKVPRLDDAIAVRALWAVALPVRQG
jgi:DNA polymerase III subunit delta